MNDIANMEFMVAYLPLIKVGLVLGLTFSTLISFRKGYKNLALVFGLLLVLLLVFTPFKYDGTNTRKHNISTQKEKTIQYNQVKETAEVVHTKKPTFQERLQAEAERSKLANEEITKEISK